MMERRYYGHKLQFKLPSGTSRGVLTHKYSGFIYTKDGDAIIGIGEISTIPGLSIDHGQAFEKILDQVTGPHQTGVEYPALDFGLEVWQLSSQSTDPYVLFESSFSEGVSGIPINGLIWMGTKSNMLNQIRSKIEEGFGCVKLKIGAIDFEDELELLRHIRNDYPSDEIEIRVDANGAFTPSDATDKLKRLAEYSIHSIEQPIRQGQWDEMARLCQENIIDIALDEELIGIHDDTTKEELLEIIRPQYIILKPSLIGGLAVADKWIELAKTKRIGWWATSALESNVGLNAIAQWVSTKDISMPQGLGTGSLFNNNVNSPLRIQYAKLWYDVERDWGFSNLGISL